MLAYVRQKMRRRVKSMVMSITAAVRSTPCRNPIQAEVWNTERYFTRPSNESKGMSRRSPATYAIIGFCPFIHKKAVARRCPK